MKTIYMPILAVFFASCLSKDTRLIRNENTYYFYFDSKFPNNSMKKYYSWKNGPIKYLYKLDTENIIFTPKDRENRNNPIRVKMLANDTMKLNVKHIKWLNSFNNIQRDSIFLKKSNKKYYIIEKDTLDNQLYLIDVVFTQEID
ncbi:hypothetical protein ES677_14575 [Bizionia gelidisalsuginis]|uniref:Uncharacterized protein n=2 Tax=Bizionia TaxID=283785 RepID=A0A8H2LCP3_9FLAO|nr:MULTISPECIES: hypothetical protein [Bizionia]TYB69083.1 hypothetical protein ES676_14320 [Bizionia saleffrena]TYC08159.1 hypothetical protein ES677_14575 [Bizionia gelidisalsuginis]